VHRLFPALNADYSDVVIQGFKLSDLAGKMLFEMTNLQAAAKRRRSRARTRTASL
jgi:hypothetical protein